MEKVKAVRGAVQAAWPGAPAPSPSLVAPVSSTEPAPVAPVEPGPAATEVDPATVLDVLVASVDGVRGAILASVDGFGIARSRSLANEPAHPAMLAAAVGLAHQLVAMGGGASLRQLLVDHDGGLLLVWPIGDERVLAVLAATSVDQRGARRFVQRHADALAQVTP
jgi:predicted regulator of Ras-like GTPase activity (Roadblock/LC7/MglB family)